MTVAEAVCNPSATPRGEGLESNFANEIGGCNGGDGRTRTGLKLL
jgi:hypothetical protein